MTHTNSTPANPAQGVSDDEIERVAHAIAEAHKLFGRSYREMASAAIAAIGAGGQAVDVETIAKAIDPGAWADDLPVPTRADTIQFHERRQASCETARRILSALSNPPAQPGWREMSSAPKDGTNILAAHYGAAIVVYWQEDRTVDGASGWANGETDMDGYFYTYPVFVWQPLPDLPVAPLPGGAK